MKKNVRLIYQDCPTCKWGLGIEEIQKYADKFGLGKVEKMPFWSKGAAEIIKDADKNGITVPFFECEGKYGESLGKLAEALGIATNKKQEKVNNGDSAKAK